MEVVKYILKHSKITGKVVFGYAGGQLRFFEDESDMSMDQLVKIFNKLPLNIERLKEVATKIGGALQVIPTDLTFLKFWNAYKKKINRYRAEPLWKKLSDADKAECIMSIPAYESFLIRSPRGKLDPENYLKKRSWENNWNSL